MKIPHYLRFSLYTLFSYKAISSSWFQRICISQINHFSNYKFHIICFWVGPQVFLMHERNKFSKNKVPGKLLPYSLYNINFLVWNDLQCTVKLKYIRYGFSKNYRCNVQKVLHSYLCLFHILCFHYLLELIVNWKISHLAKQENVQRSKKFNSLTTFHQTYIFLTQLVFHRCGYSMEK